MGTSYERQRLRFSSILNNPPGTHTTRTSYIMVTSHHHRVYLVEGGGGETEKEKLQLLQKREGGSVASVTKNNTQHSPVTDCCPLPLPYFTPAALSHIILLFGLAAFAKQTSNVRNPVCERFVSDNPGGMSGNWYPINGQSKTGNVSGEETRKFESEREKKHTKTWQTLLAHARWDKAALFNTKTKIKIKSLSNLKILNSRSRGFLPKASQNCKIFNIFYDTTENELKDLFHKYGPAKVKLMMSENSNKNKGHAFIEYTDPAHAKEAVKQLNGYQLRETKIKVQFNTKQPPWYAHNQNQLHHGHHGGYHGHHRRHHENTPSNSIYGMFLIPCWYVPGWYVPG
eukprot:sb/3466405/